MITGVQTLAPKHGTHVTVALARIGLANSAPLVFGYESLSLGVFTYFRTLEQLSCARAGNLIRPTGTPSFRHLRHPSQVTHS